MTENLLTIVFGCLATVLAIAGIILACLQFRAHIRQSTRDATPSVMENANVSMPTASGHRRLELGRSDWPNILPVMIFDGLALASVSHHVRVRRSTCCA